MLNVGLTNLESYEEYEKMVEHAERGMDAKIGNLSHEQTLFTPNQIRVAALATALAIVVIATLVLGPVFISATIPYTAKTLPLIIALDLSVFIPGVSALFLTLQIIKAVKSETLFNFTSPANQNKMANALKDRKFCEMCDILAKHHLTTSDIIGYGLLGSEATAHDYAAFTALVPMRNKACDLLTGIGENIMTTKDFTGYEVIKQLDEYYERAIAK